VLTWDPDTKMETVTNNCAHMLNISEVTRRDLGALCTLSLTTAATRAEIAPHATVSCFSNSSLSHDGMTGYNQKYDRIYTASNKHLNF